MWEGAPKDDLIVLTSFAKKYDKGREGILFAITYIPKD
jgi:hypothetical protein